MYWGTSYTSSIEGETIERFDCEVCGFVDEPALRVRARGSGFAAFGLGRDDAIEWEQQEAQKRFRSRAAGAVPYLRCPKCGKRSPTAVRDFPRGTLLRLGGSLAALAASVLVAISAPGLAGQAAVAGFVSLTALLYFALDRWSIWSVQTRIPCWFPSQIPGLSQSAAAVAEGRADPARVAQHLECPKVLVDRAAQVHLELSDKRGGTQRLAI